VLGERAGAIVFLDDREHAIVDEAPDAVAYDAFVFAQQSIDPIEVQFFERNLHIVLSVRCGTHSTVAVNRRRL
jgi:hypothetical protein